MLDVCNWQPILRHFRWRDLVKVKQQFKEQVALATWFNIGDMPTLPFKMEDSVIQVWVLYHLTV